MIVLLWALTLFNAAASCGAVAAAMRLLTAEERAHWRSKRLLRMADAFAWSLPVIGVGGTVLAWVKVQSGHQAGALIAFAPIGFLLLMGIVFAVVDYAEDGILGNAREP